jgi:hypothetical protein
MRFNPRILFSGLLIATFFSFWVLSQSAIPIGFSQVANSHEKVRAESPQENKPSEFQQDIKRISMMTESRDLKGLLLLSDELEKKWANNVVAYSRLLAEISNSLASYDFHDAMQYKYSVSLAGKVLKNADDIPIQLEYEMVSKLQSTSAYLTGVERQDNWERDRAKRVNLIFHLWNRLEKNIDRTFDITDFKNHPMGNIPVPGPYPSGIRPEAVKEPDIRAKYIEAIAVNQAKAEKYNLQVQLQKLDKVLPEFVERVLIEFYSLEPTNMKELEASVRLFGFSSEIKQKILMGVNKPQPTK